MTEKKIVDIRRDIFRNKKKIPDCGITANNYETEVDLYVKEKRNELYEESNSPRTSIQRLPPDRNTQTPGKINCNELDEDNEKNI